MNQHEKDWLRSRAFGEIYDLWHDCDHIHHNDLEAFKQAMREGLESALRKLS